MLQSVINTHALAEFNYSALTKTNHFFSKLFEN